VCGCSFGEPLKQKFQTSLYIFKRMLKKNFAARQY
jgi:hypothetical protein